MNLLFSHLGVVVPYMPLKKEFETKTNHQELSIYLLVNLNFCWVKKYDFFMQFSVQFDHNSVFSSHPKKWMPSLCPFAFAHQ